jgi:MYXO-CTERM domain-containing protein
MVEAHAFAGVVPSGYKLERLDVNKDHLEIGYEDDAGPAATVMLTPPGSGSAATPADARGPHFEHRLVELRGRPSGPARAAMLSAALLVDKAIPADELAACGASTDPRASKPNKHIVTMGAAALMVLAAIAFLIGRRRRPAPGGGEAPPPATP